MSARIAAISDFTSAAQSALSRTPVDEKIARAKNCQHQAAVLFDQCADCDFAFDNDVQSVSGLSFLEDAIARPVDGKLSCLLQSLQLRRQQSGEELALFQGPHGFR